MSNEHMISMKEFTVDIFYQMQAIAKQMFALFLDLIIYLFFILVTLIALDNNQESRLLTWISRQLANAHTILAITVN